MTCLTRGSEDGKVHYNRGVWSIHLSLALVLGLKTIFAWAHIVFLHGKKGQSSLFMSDPSTKWSQETTSEKKNRTGTGANFLQSQQITWKWQKGTSNYFSQINIYVNTCKLTDHLIGLSTGTWDVLEAGQCTWVNSATWIGSETRILAWHSL